MKKSIATILITCVLTTMTALCWAEGKKDHVCFRVLDSDKNGRVTFREFEKVYGHDEEKFKEADVDKDGQLTHDEYHHLLGHGSTSGKQQ